MGISNERKDQKTLLSLHIIERKGDLNILGVTCCENPRSWDIQFHNMMVKANSRLSVLRACKYYGHTLEELTILFDSFMSVFSYGIEV